MRFRRREGSGEGLGWLGLGGESFFWVLFLCFFSSLGFLNVIDVFLFLFLFSVVFLMFL